MYLMCISNVSWIPLGSCKIHAKCQDTRTCILLECNRAFKIHLRYIKIHAEYMYSTGYMQDTYRIHHDTTGYVSDRKSPPKRIGTPPIPPNAPPRAHPHAHAPECPQPRARKPGRRAPLGLASQESLLNSLSCNELQTRTLQIMRETPVAVPVAVLPPVSFYQKRATRTPGVLRFPSAVPDCAL